MDVKRIASGVMIVVALAMVVYHLATAFFILQPHIPHLNTHLGFAFILVFLSGYIKAEGKRQLWYLAMLLLSLTAVIFMQLSWEQLEIRAFFNKNIDLIMGGILIVVLLEGSRQAFGLTVPILVGISIIYPFIGVHLPEPFKCGAMSVPHTIANLTIGLQGVGVYGMLLGMSIRFVFLFVLFGGILQATGGIRFFELLARAVAGKLQGGPALMAVISSCLVGSLSGSPSANVTITGSFTIPLMKSVGYKPEQAAAVEAAASNGGLIMPPIMGVGAFIIAGMTGISYVLICAMSILPALIFYFCTGTYVYLRAGQLGIRRMTGEVNIKELIALAPVFVIPFGVIIGLLVAGYSVLFTGFWAVVVLVLVLLVRKETRPSLGKWIEGFVDGAVKGGSIGVVLACLAMMMASFTMSGLGVKLSYGIELWSAGYLIVALLLTWLICVILGTAGVFFAAYILISMFAVPALMRMGVPEAQGHLFIYLATSFAGVTPPVALTAVVAAKIAQSKYMQTAIETGKIAAAGLLLPMVLIYAPIVMLQPVEPTLEIIRLIGFVISLVALQIAFVGYYFRTCNRLERTLITGAAVLLLVFVVVQQYALFAVGIGLFALVTLWQWQKNRSENTTTTH